MSQHSIVGFWKIISNKIKLEDGTWKGEIIFGGTLAISEKKDICLFLRTDQGPWGYSGKFEWHDDKITIQVEATAADEVENISFVRNLKFIDQDKLIFSGVESHTGRPFEAVFIRSV